MTTSFSTSAPPPHLGVEIHVHAAVVLELGLTDDVVVSEVVKARQDVAQPQDLPELPDELLLLGLRGDHLPRLEPGSQFANLLQVVLQVLLVRLEEHQPACGLVAEQGDGLIGLLLQVPEADHVAVGLDRVEDPVRARERLDEPVRAQRLVHPQGVERLGVDPGEEHVDHDDQVDRPLRQPPGDVLVVALEALCARVVGGAELRVVVADCLIEEGTVVRGQLRGVHGLIGQRLTGGVGVGRVGVDDADAQAPARGQPLLLSLELHVVGTRRPDRRRRERESCSRPRGMSPCVEGEYPAAWNASAEARRRVRGRPDHSPGL